jgi:hypothetical protein
MIPNLRLTNIIYSPGRWYRRCHILLRLLPIVLVLTLGLFTCCHSKALAATCTFGKNFPCGYFYGMPQSGEQDRVFDCGLNDPTYTDITSTTQFETQIETWANGQQIPGTPSGPATCSSSSLVAEYTTGARYVISSMIDNPPGGGTAEYNGVPSEFNQFDDLMTQIASGGECGVAPWTHDCYAFNVTPEDLEPSGQVGDLVTQLNAQNTDFDTQYSDIDSIIDQDVSDTTQLILFHYSNPATGDTYNYFIKEDCGNPVGTGQAAPINGTVTFTVTPTCSKTDVISGTATTSPDNDQITVTLFAGTNYTDTGTSPYSFNFPSSDVLSDIPANGSQTFTLTAEDVITGKVISNSVTCTRTVLATSACSSYFSAPTGNASGTAPVETVDTTTTVKGVATPIVVTLTPQSTSVTATLQGGIAYPVSITGSPGSFSFLAGTYYGFQTVTFTANSVYTGSYVSTSKTGVITTHTITQTFPDTLTLPIPNQAPTPTTSPVTAPVLVCDTLQCQDQMNQVLGVGRQNDGSFEIDYTVTYPGAPGNIGELGGAPTNLNQFMIESTGLFANVATQGSYSQNVYKSIPIGSLATVNQNGDEGQVLYATNNLIAGEPSGAGGWAINWYLTGNGLTPNSNTESFLSNYATSTINPCTTLQPITVAYQPYFQVQQGDVTVGENFPDPTSGVCTSGNKSSGIFGWNDNDDSAEPVAYGYPDGAGTALAALATGDINGFVSDQSATNTTFPNNLTFANDSDIQDDLSGPADFGGFYGSLPCQPNYWQESPGGTAAVCNPPISTMVNGVAQQTIYCGGTVNDLAASIKLPITEPTTVYVNGNVIIKSDVMVTNNLPPTGPLDNINSFELVANGNIYINGSVKTLQGIYIAQAATNPGTGIIVTCSQAPLYLIFPGYSTCDNPLTVDGALAADQIYLFRTYSTLGSDNYAADPPPTSFEKPQPYSPAEIINNEPVYWLGIQTNAPVYDSLSSLPPVIP